LYGKIFESIFNSTLVAEGGYLPTYIFMSMIVLADKDGIVNLSSKALYNRLGFRDYDSKITQDDFNKALEYLQREDPESNSQVEDGRRIIPLIQIDEIPDNRGWLIVNYQEYAKKASKHDDREATAARVKRFRERAKQCNGDVTGCNGLKRNDNGKNGHIDIDIDIDKKSSNLKVTCDESSSQPPNCPHNEIIAAYNKILPELPHCKTFSDQYRAMLRTRWREDQCRQSVEWWEGLFNEIRESDFLMGRVNGWRADLTWIVRPKNFTKIVNGNYRNKADDRFSQ
jgi:hypothetical protein